MRIVVSGTHASGKSTLVADFAAAHPGYLVLGDPFELLDEADAADAGSFVAQLRIAAARLRKLPAGAQVVAERGPLDFLAYLDALESLGRASGIRDLLRAGAESTRAAMEHVDLLVLLPLGAPDLIEVPADEDPQLRSAMDAALLEFAGDPDLTGAARVVELSGSPERRLESLLTAID